ncbi:hypothetical protein VULLAG_LOCUS19251 [Vulpes lagopus]
MHPANCAPNWTTSTTGRVCSSHCFHPVSDKAHQTYRTLWLPMLLLSFLPRKQKAYGSDHSNEAKLKKRPEMIKFHQEPSPGAKWRSPHISNDTASLAPFT